jgi:hypothetical protein
MCEDVCEFLVGEADVWGWRFPRKGLEVFLERRASQDGA